MTFKRIVTAIVVVLIGVIAYSCFYTIHETQQGVLTNFGKISPPVKEPGLHVKWPWPISKIYKLNVAFRPSTPYPRVDYGRPEECPG